MKTVDTAYQANEESSQRQAAEIYHIWRVAGGVHWRYTSSDTPITFNGDIYTPATIERDAVSYSSTLEVTTVNVRAAVITNPVVEFLALNPIETLWIDIRKLFLDQSPMTGVVIFVGQIKSVSFQGSAAQAECVGFESYLKQLIPIHRYQAQCNNFIYDTKCGVVKENYAINATLSYVSPDKTVIRSSTFAGQADGYFSLGYVKFGDYYRFITDHVGDRITMRYYLYPIAVNDSVTVYPGCNWDVQTCLDKFNNINNFFGHPYIPIKNPVIGL